MDQLPNEIVELILSSPGLPCEIILNFGSTSKHFYYLVRNSSFIWKKKYQERYPGFQTLFHNGFNEWCAEMVYASNLRIRTIQLLSTMPPRFYKQNELSDSDFTEWVTLMHESARASHYIRFFLDLIVEDYSPIKSIKVVPLDTPGNKTTQYYATKVLRFMHQKSLTETWETYAQLPYNEKLLEKGATYIAQWCQPAIKNWNNVSEQLDDLAKQVIKEVASEYPNHPLLKVSEEVLLYWKLHNPDENQWNVIECRDLMKCIVSVIYVHNGFRGNNVAYYMPENSYINEVLTRKQGLPITLAVIFESVARRVGLKCEPASFPSHFLLKFTEGKGETYAESYYIDVFNNGNIIRKGSCPYNPQGNAGNPHRNLYPCTPHEICKYMVTQIEAIYHQSNYSRGNNVRMLRSILELAFAMDHQDIRAIVCLARFYMVHNIETTPVEKFLLSHKCRHLDPDPVQNVALMLEDYKRKRESVLTSLTSKIEAKERSEDLKFAVGMVMKHIKYNYVCIIFGWDITCQASHAWQQEMGLSTLKYADKQPFYNVLVEDGSRRYAAQENLIPTKHTGFLYLNEDIGKYFSHFYETHYVPNAEKEQEYPIDANIRRRFHENLQCENYVTLYP